MATGASSTVRAALTILAVACLTAAAIPVADAAHTTGEIAESLLAQAIIGQAPTRTGLVPAAGFPGTFDDITEISSNVTFDEETILNTMALGRQGGVAPTPRGTSDRDTRAAHTIDARTLPLPGPVLNALLITTFDSPIVAAALRATAAYSLLGVKSPPLPVQLLALSADAWEHTDEARQRVRLDTDTTQAGLVLLSAGVPVTTEDLTRVEHDATHVARLEHDVALPIPVVAAAVKLGATSAGPVALNALQDATRASTQTTGHLRDVRVDPDHALLAAAAARQLILVEPSDVMQGQDVVTHAIDDVQRATIDRGTLLSALLLGTHAVSQREPTVRATLTPDALVAAIVRIDVTDGSVAEP